MNKLLLSIGALLLFAGTLCGQTKSIKNGVSWYDTNGKMIQAHGVSILKHQGVYYMLGEDRSNTYTFKGVNLYSSTDLMNWEFRNTIIDRNTNSHLSNLERITERPCLLYNAQTGKFVVWLKYQNGSYTNNKAAIFHCNTIDGKYTYEKEFFPGGYDSNDCSFFVDDDGTAYYISTCKEFNSLNLYKLSSDYMDVESATILSKNEAREAPVIMRKGDLYYLFSSGKSGWDPNPLKYSTSKSLTQGWSAWTTIADRMSYDSQPTCYLQITGTEGTSYFYVGDRWKDPGLPESKTVIFPLDLNNGIVDIHYVYEFKIDLEKGTWKEVDDNEYISQANWKVVSSTGGISGNNIAGNAIDGNPDTFWQTSGAGPHPHEIVIDLGANETVSGFKYIQRNDNNIFGIVKEYKLYLSNDLNNWGDPVSQGWMSYTAEKNFQPTQVHYMRFVADSEHGRWDNTKYASAAELKLIKGEMPISKSAWKIHSVDSQADGNQAEKIFDGDYATIWHTPWGGAQTDFPHEVAINLGASYKISEFSYVPRQDASSNGMINQYELFISEDGNNWGSPVATGTWPETKDEKTVKFAETKGSFVKLVALREVNGNAWASAAEINIYGKEAGPTFANKEVVTNSDDSFSLYPNPAKDNFYVHLNNAKNAEISVFDSNGSLRTVVKTNKQIVCFHKYPLFKRGMYVVKVKDENEKYFSKKLIVD